MDWLKENGFGGIMVWSIDMDDFSGKCGNNKYPLLHALNEQLKNYRVNLEYDGPYEVHGPRGAYTTKDRKIHFIELHVMNGIHCQIGSYVRANARIVCVKYIQRLNETYLMQRVTKKHVIMKDVCKMKYTLFLTCQHFQNHIS